MPAFGDASGVEAIDGMEVLESAAADVETLNLSVIMTSKIKVKSIKQDYYTWY
jgi:hypothetical protein